MTTLFVCVSLHYCDSFFSFMVFCWKEVFLHHQHIITINDTFMGLFLTGVLCSLTEIIVGKWQAWCIHQMESTYLAVALWVPWLHIQLLTTLTVSSVSCPTQWPVGHASHLMLLPSLLVAASWRSLDRQTSLSLLWMQSSWVRYVCSKCIRNLVLKASFFARMISCRD